MVGAQCLVVLMVERCREAWHPGYRCDVQILLPIVHDYHRCLNVEVECGEVGGHMLVTSPLNPHLIACVLLWAETLSKPSCMAH